MPNLEVQNNPFTSILMVGAADPASLPDADPAAGSYRIAPKTDGTLWIVNSAGVATQVGGTTGLTDPMTSRGDIIIRNASNVTDRLGKGSAGTVLTSDGTDVAWTAPTGSGFLQSSRIRLTSGNLTTTSTSFVDATGLTTTITTGARRCLIIFSGNVGNSTNGEATGIDVAVDGTRQGNGTFGLFFVANPSGVASANINAGFTYLSDVLSAGSHTFKIQWRTQGGTGTMTAGTNAPAVLTVIETNLTT